MPCVREFGPPTPSLNIILQIRHMAVENKLVMSKKVIEKLTKNNNNNKKKQKKNKKTKKQKKKLGLPTNKTLQEKIQPKIINLSKCHLTKFQVLLLTKGPKFCPTTKRNVFDIKSDTKELARKLKVREI